jgi:two-component system, NtrC family, sensor kinase
MRLAAKLILLYLLGLLMIVGVFAVLTAQNERRLAAAEHGRRSAELVASMRPYLYGPLVRGDRSDIERVIRQTTRQIRSVEMRYLLPSGDVLTQRQVTTTIVPGTDGSQLVSTVPLAGADEHYGAIEITSNDDTSSDRLQRSLIRSGIALASAMLLSGLVIYIGGIYMVGRPLNQLIEKVERIGEGNFEGPIAVDRRDELGLLGRSINQMCERLQTQRETITRQAEEKLQTLEQLRHADRLSSVGRLAAGVAHEMGTPLGVVSGRAELIASGDLQGEDARHSAAIIKSESDRISSIIRQLLGFARRNTGKQDSTNLMDIIRQTIELVTPMAEKKGIAILLQPSNEQAMVKLDASQFKQVLLNLIENAFESHATNVIITVFSTSPSIRQEQDRFWTVSISDDGEGIEPDVKEHIFEPFFTTRQVGSGTGLGLSIAYGIVADHGGSIDVESRPGEGSTFSIRLPQPIENASVNSGTSHG